MKYLRIPYVNKPVSRIFYGTAIPPFNRGEDGNDLLDSILATGVNAFDCARNYNLSEISLGKWIEERGVRDKIVLLTKCAHHDDFGNKRVSPKCILEDYAVSSEYLRTSFFDIYLLHRDDPSQPVGPIVEVMNDLHADGKIGAFGGSNWTHQRVEEANEYAYAHNLIPFSVSSPNFCLAHTGEDPWGGGCVSITGAENKEARDWYIAQNMPVIAYSSMARGFFSGRIKSSDSFEKAKSLLDEPAIKAFVSEENFERLRRCENLSIEKGVTVAQIALAWIYAQQVNTFAVLSTSSAERMKANIAALDLGLTAAEAAWLNLEAEAL